MQFGRGAPTSVLSLGSRPYCLASTDVPPLLSSDSASRGPHKMRLCQTARGALARDRCRGTYEPSTATEIGGQVSRHCRARLKVLITLKVTDLFVASMISNSAPL